MTNPIYTDEQVLEHAAWQSVPTKAMILSLLADRQRLQAEVIDVISLMKECALYLECNDPKAPPLKRVHHFLAARATPNETKEAKS
ncbi:hypothetical protein ISN75_06635 [Dyella marensis]|uniref:hypothetical protein n=1 Tax=Dyella marensis TaxID=500610 RepID=UPI0031D6FD68